MGVRVDEWDARPPEFTQTIPELAAEARLVFEIVRPRGAEPIATYGTDFYAGTPAVTRNPYGDGEGWYVATALGQPGVDEVVRRVLTRHDLLGPYAATRRSRRPPVSPPTAPACSSSSTTPPNRPV